MNPLLHGMISPDVLREHSWKLWSAATIVQLAFAVAGVLYGWFWAFLPLVVLVCAIAIASPRAGVYILATAIYFRYSLPGYENAYPADVVAFLVIVGTLTSRLMRGERIIEHTWVNRPLALILIVFAASLTMAFDLSPGIKNWLRHAQLFGLIVAVVTCLEQRDVFALVRWMLILTAIFSLGNIAAYIAVGGEERIFGPASAFFAIFTVLAALHAAVGFLMSPRKSHSWAWGFLLLIYTLAVLATQTRAAMIQMILGLVLLISVVWIWGARSGQPYLRRQVLVFLTVLSVVGLIIVADWIPLFHRPAARITEVLEGHAHTVNLRMFLWKTGLHAFSDSPILGIGLGQVQRWDQFLPYWRFDVSSFATRGLGAHNDFITYIAETGILGISALLWLLWCVFNSGIYVLRRVRSHDEAKMTMMLWIPVTGIVFGFFFSTHMFYSIPGMLTAIYIALWVRYSQSYLNGGGKNTAASPRPISRSQFS
jgi:O-antigen ligase